ncbi:MAG: PPC domain-containing protein [Gemmataceae bacterium]|nr:PPC domain-containing protein [Gemmataceae bacterium]
MFDVGDTLAAGLPTDIARAPGRFVLAAERIGDGPFGLSDVDLYRVSASAGTRFFAETSRAGNEPPVDTMLRLFGAQGVELAFDDNSGLFGYSRLEYRFTTDGTYYLGVSGSANRSYNPNLGGSGPGGSTGTYRLVLGDADLAARDGLTRANPSLGNGPIGGPVSPPPGRDALPIGASDAGGPAAPILGAGVRPPLPGGGGDPQARDPGPAAPVADMPNGNNPRNPTLAPPADARVVFLLREPETLTLAQTLRSNFLNQTDVALAAAEEVFAELASEEADASTVERLTVTGDPSWRNPLLRLARARRRQVADLMPLNESTPAVVATLMTGDVDTETETTVDAAVPGGGEGPETGDRGITIGARRPLATTANEVALLEFLAGWNDDPQRYRPRSREELLGLTLEEVVVARARAILDHLRQAKLLLVVNHLDDPWQLSAVSSRRVLDGVVSAIGSFLGPFGVMRRRFPDRHGDKGETHGVEVPLLEPEAEDDPGAAGVGALPDGCAPLLFFLCMIQSSSSSMSTSQRAAVLGSADRRRPLPG